MKLIASSTSGFEGLYTEGLTSSFLSNLWDRESHPATIAREYTAPALSTTARVLSR